MSGYFDTLKTGVTTILTGLGITWKHLLNATKRKGFAGVAEDHYFNQVDGLVTLQYPSEAVPMPSFARYRLHNNADDCIGCDQCAKACPVNCITIESFKATPDDVELLGKTSDGTKKRLWLPVFDIDMGKCLFCGLCTYPCPTECLTMTPVHDFTEFEREHLIYHFGNMTKAMEAEKRKKLQEFEAQKKASGAAKPAGSAKPKAASPAGRKMSPMMAAKMAAKKQAEGGESQAADGGEKSKPKLSPALAAKMAAAKKKKEGDAGNEGEQG